MNTKLIIAVVIIIFAIGGIFFWTNQQREFQEQQREERQENQELTEPQKLAGTVSPYYEFTQIAYEQALSENKIILLYFYADWCPICAREQQDDTLPAFNELQNENLIGFRVHYNDNKVTSSEEALAKQFGITYQHTKVILKNGQQILKDLNSWNKAKYLED